MPSNFLIIINSIRAVCLLHITMQMLWLVQQLHTYPEDDYTHIHTPHSGCWSKLRAQENNEHFISIHNSLLDESFIWLSVCVCLWWLRWLSCTSLPLSAPSPVSTSNAILVNTFLLWSRLMPFSFGARACVCAPVESPAYLLIVYSKSRQSCAHKVHYNLCFLSFFLCRRVRVRRSRARSSNNV